MNVYAVRLFMTCAVISACLVVSAAVVGPLANLRKIDWSSYLSRSHKLPDFSVYRHLDTLPAERFPINATGSGRTLILGDIHGMNDSLHNLLNSLSYDSTHDSLIHVGDIVAKGPISGSLAVLSFMSTHNITGVRGNHDQKVIEWYGWLQWIHARPSARHWLSTLERRWASAEAAGEDDLEEWLERQYRRRGSGEKRWWKSIAKNWELLGPHYEIARAMTPEHYAYMVARPLALHIPSAHAFIVHAGMLASDPNYHPHHKKQPLAHAPELKSSGTKFSGKKARVEEMRRLQELALREDVPQNQDPFATQNMRSVLPDNTVTRGKDGKPWSNFWNRDMSLCDGFDGELEHAGHGKGKKNAKIHLPCYPATVIYGHAAGRGLDIKRWSLGLDSGCVCPLSFVLPSTSDLLLLASHMS
ncbi:hypothetical protein HGRIS_003452 [Hohenbuehelia grisea]|uniref:Calcineurin-like phosphoesterase domain-containing protein n=1 Tax=Hohenbuehelia grisea TaxID=104357 RepID=A0ABR3JFI5_9AGAR